MNLQAIQQAVQNEINNPKRCYMPNSPAGSVCNRLIDQNLLEESKWFWENIVWRRKFNVQAIDELIPTLNDLNKQERMPAWGTYGT